MNLSDRLLPAPPSTDDPITWVAIVLVGLLVLAVLGVGGWIAKIGFPRLIGAIETLSADAKTERAAAALERKDQLKAFRDELQLERTANAALIADDRRQRSELAGELRGSIDRVHERIDGLASSLVTCEECQLETAKRLSAHTAGDDAAAAA